MDCAPPARHAKSVMRGGEKGSGRRVNVKAERSRLSVPTAGGRPA